MERKKILYVSGSFGLGHITRDVAIANALRQRIPIADVYWLAGEPAKSYLEQYGETLVEEARFYGSDTDAAEKASNERGLNLLSYIWRARGEWLQNVMAFKQTVAHNHFDIVIGDETYEIILALLFRMARIDVPFVMVYDFVGLDASSKNLFHSFPLYFLNLSWSLDRTILTGRNLGLFVGEPQDIPDRRMGFLLPNRRKHAEINYKFIGYILGFNPEELADKSRIRARLGYGKKPLIVCSVGGTSVGRGLLELCGRAYRILRTKLGEVKIVMVCGPRIDPGSLDVPNQVEVKGFVPDLYKLFAASDLAVVVGGGTTTLELTALRTPFLFFPIEGQTEQEIAVAGRLARHGAGVKMSYSLTTPELLANEIIKNLNLGASWNAIPADGAARAAELISELLDG